MSMKYIAIGAVALAIIGGLGYYTYTALGAGGQRSNAAQIPPDRVQAQEIKVGEGLQAEPGDTVSVLYRGQLTDGTVFDSSEAHGNEPLVFTLGTSGLIPGFQIGVNGMREGGERLMAIPPQLGYGAQDVKDANGKVIVPANSTLVFNVRLVKVTKASTTTAQTTRGEESAKDKTSTSSESTSSQ